MPEPKWVIGGITQYVGSSREVLIGIPSASVHCVVTSPPYWGLRDYGVSGALGSEPSVEQYVTDLCDILDEVKRVLRPDGTLWLNLGDCYSSKPPGNKRPSTGFQSGSYGTERYEQVVSPRTRPDSAGTGLPNKHLVGVPWRVAFELQRRGWYLRSDIIWHKPNPMPGSMRDRCTSAHEYLFMLAQRPRYYFDGAAIAVPVQPASADRYAYAFGGAKNRQLKQTDNPTAVVGSRQPDGKANRRDVWKIGVARYKGAHFATFPEALVEPCIKAGTSERGVCGTCGAPWRRVVEKQRVATRPARTSKLTGDPATDGNRDPLRHVSVVVGYQWEPTCRCCDGEQIPATVLDPFSGSATVGVVACKLGRQAVLIDIKDDYAEQGRSRLAALVQGESNAG